MAEAELNADDLYGDLPNAPITQGTTSDTFVFAQSYAPHAPHHTTTTTAATSTTTGFPVCTTAATTTTGFPPATFGFHGFHPPSNGVGNGDNSGAQAYEHQHATAAAIDLAWPNVVFNPDVARRIYTAVANNAGAPPTPANFVAARLLAASATKKARQHTESILKTWRTNKMSPYPNSEIWMQNYEQRVNLARNGHLALCMRLNHIKGRGCTKDGCKFTHACLLCQAPGHGAFQNDISGQPMCPKAAMWDDGLRDLLSALGCADVLHARAILAKAYAAFYLRISENDPELVQFNRLHDFYPFKKKE